MMKKFLKLWLLALLFMLIFDSIWLNIMYSKLYQPLMPTIITGHFYLIPAIIFYLIYTFCLSKLVLEDATKNKLKTKEIFFRSFLYGIACYSTYDLTNHATLVGWSWGVTIIDILWGGLLTSLVGLMTLKKIK